MGEEFQAGVCGSTWWSSPRGSLGLSPCLMTMNDFGSFGWPNDHLVEMKARSNTTRDVSDSIPDHVPTLFQDIQKPSQPGSSDRVFMDSTLQMMGIGLSSSSSITTTTTDWNQTLISGSGRNENNYHSSVLQESGFNPPSNQSPKEWCVKNFSQNSNINELKQTNQGFPMESTFPMASSSYGFPSTLIQTLFDDDPLPVLENQTVNFPSTTANYRTNMNDFSPSLAKLPSLLGPSLAKQQAISTPLHLTSNTPFWNASTGAPSASIFPSTQLNFLKLTTKANNEAVQESKKSSGEPAFKRQRIETPSPLPTFKVRKEKLGDRVTALQQLVSPFGKTDTASVLQEAIEYIKFLHDQVNGFSTPYMKNGAPIHQQQNYDKPKNTEGPKQDLKSRGLCLVPISSTFPVANETAVDFWTPTFGGQFR